jgi:hypothetical protein
MTESNWRREVKCEDWRNRTAILKIDGMLGCGSKDLPAKDGFIGT